MTDVNFPITEAKSPASAIAGKIAYTTGVDGNDKVLLEDSIMTINSNGEVADAVFLDNIIDTSITSTVQTVAGDGAVTIDLTDGTIIKLILSANTVITFTGLPMSGYLKAIEIKVIHDATANAYTLTFNHTHKKEGAAPLVFTNTSSSQDNLSLIIREDGTLYSRTVVNNMKTTGVVVANINPNIEGAIAGQNSYVTPRVDGVKPGALISCMADGTLNSTDIICDGYNRITSQVELVNCTAQNQSFAIAVAEITGGAITLNVGMVRFFLLNQDADINTINIVGTDIDLYSFAFVFRMKDNSATPRLITFDPNVFDWEMEPVLTQTANAEDIILIQSFAGINTLVVLNNFGV